MYYQIQLRARDHGEPEQTTDTRVIVTVERDQRAPRFRSTKYTADIQEVARVDTVIEIKPDAIKAEDDDTKVRQWH